MYIDDPREAREARCFLQVLLFVALASALQLTPWRLPLAHRQDTCTRAHGRFAAVARAYCPATPAKATDGSVPDAAPPSVGGAARIHSSVVAS